jgi:hypothetical protein
MIAALDVPIPLRLRSRCPIDSARHLMRNPAFGVEESERYERM